MTKYIRVDYTVKADVDLENLKAAITEFDSQPSPRAPVHLISTSRRPQSVHPHWRGRRGGASRLAEATLFPAFHAIFAGTVLRWIRSDTAGSRSFDDGRSAGSTDRGSINKPVVTGDGNMGDVSSAAAGS
jgi:hypothetical protein